MGKHSKRDRRMTMSHTMNVPYGKAQIRFLKDPNSQVEKKYVKRSLKNELRSVIGMLACSGIGFAIYLIACEVMK